MKITKSSDKVNPFGGINFVIAALQKIGIMQVIDNQLGSRAGQADYSYSDIILGHCYANLCGAERLEDVEKLRPILGIFPDFKSASSDTTSRVMRSLAVPTQILNHNGTFHQINRNEKLNKLLVELSVGLGLIVPDSNNTLDFDHVILENGKYDSSKTYKFNDGYQPGVASIGKTIVGVEGRGGNSPAKFLMHETLEDIFDELAAKNIRIHCFRSDSAAYQNEVFELVEQRCDYFYIRMRQCAAFRQQLALIEHWTPCTINYVDYELASVEYTPTGMKKACRVVVYRTPDNSNKGQIDLLTGDCYKYMGIITNDRHKSEEEIISFYNLRGGSETNFDALNNDFNWSRLPFSELHENTVFMLIAAMINNIYHYLLDIYSKRVPFVKKAYRLKNFLFNFIIVPAKWIRRGRQNVLKLFSQKPYELCLG